MPAAKEGTIDHCWWCKKPIQFSTALLSEQQEQENAEARASGKKEPHHRSHYRRWTHYPEAPGENNIHCPGQEEGRRRSALATNYCGEHTQGGRWSSGSLCNRAVKGEWGGRPLCGLHLAAERKRAKEEEERQQQQDLKEWALKHAKEQVDHLRAYGLEAQPHEFWSDYTHVVTGKVVVDPVKLLELLEETFGPRPS